MDKFGIIYADPPWSYRVWSEKGKGRSAENHYPTMSNEDICTLPVAEIAAKDSVLFLWATFPNLPIAFEVIEAWGFTYKTVAFTWVKTCRKSPGYFVSLGHWTRANAEVCLLATKGNPRRISKSVRQLIVSPLRQHSQKPDETRERIVELMGDLPRVELFAREKVAGWAAWGNEIEPDISL
jgi:N6-adenosine-specific RNA methylase IME4